MNPAIDSHWREQALCAEVDPELSFPEPGESASAARAVCAACPVRAECLADALGDRDIAFGVRGGLSPVERRTLVNGERPGRAA